MISEEKQTLRAKMRETLGRMSPEDRANRSAAIGEFLVDGLRGAVGWIFAFAPLRAEPDWIARLVATGWPLALPRIDGDELHFHAVTDLQGLVSGALGIREPSGDAKSRVSLAEAAAVLVPGVAFDRQGGRLGRGRGYYDRLLAEAPSGLQKVGIGFECQVVDRVPLEAHDVAMDAVVTEGGWHAVRSSPSCQD